MFFLVLSCLSTFLPMALSEGTEGICGDYKIWFSEFRNCDDVDEQRLSINGLKYVLDECDLSIEGCIDIVKRFGDDEIEVDYCIYEKFVTNNTVLNGKLKDGCKQAEKHKNTDNEEASFFLDALQARNFSCPQEPIKKCAPPDMVYSVSKFQEYFPVTLGKKYTIKAVVWEDIDKIACYAIDCMLTLK